MPTKFALLFVIICLFLLKQTTYAKVKIEDVKSTLEKAKENAWKSMKEDIWFFPPYLGPMFFSEYYFELQILNLTQKSKFNISQFTKLLLDTQLEDGSWVQVEDKFITTGQLDATIFNYWYLKSVGIDSESYQMQKAKYWILKNGGIEGAQTMSLFKLASFGHYPWNKIYSIPLFIFDQSGFFSGFYYIKDKIAQWVYPHLLPLAYLRHFSFVRKVGADIKELWLNYPSDSEIQQTIYPSSSQKPSESEVNLIQEIMKLRQKKGSFGAYTISTILVMITLDDYNKRFPNLINKEINDCIEKGFNFIEFNYFNYLVPYQGTLDDGRWWDTLLVSWGLLEAGEDPHKLIPTVDKFLREGVQSNGGIAYGIDFEYAPDADDTGIMAIVLSYFGQKYQKQLNVTQNWLLSMQNSDGGFPAFDKEKLEGNIIFDLAFKLSGIANSAEIYDPSSPDVTAHIMEGLASAGYNMHNNLIIEKSIAYLRDSFDSQLNAWQARWGINFIYSIGAVLPALRKVGFDLKDEMINKAIVWLKSKQNSDGGFGETTLSYNFPEKYNGVGKSTVTQTAWGLLALLEVKDIYDVDSNIDRAVYYLVDQFRVSGNIFFDTSVVGTGHRGLLYLQYPSYAYSFPMIALARYMKTMKEK